MYVEAQNLEMALHSCQGTAFLSHPQHNPLTERGKRRKGLLRFYRYGVVSQNLRAAHRGREGIRLVCASRLPTSPGEKPWKMPLETLPANEPFGDPPGTLGLVGAARAPALPAGSPSRAGRKQMKHSWHRLYFPNSLLPHRKRQITIPGQLPRLLHACW